MWQHMFCVSVMCSALRHASTQNTSQTQGYVSSKASARKPDTQPSAPHNTDNLKTKAPNTTGSNHLYNTLELLMMGIVVPETCWASNNICDKNHLLHLVGILFPHIVCFCWICSMNTKLKWRWCYRWHGHGTGWSVAYCQNMFIVG